MTLTKIDDEKKQYAEISGYASLYNVPDATGDIIAPKAFSNINSKKLIPALPGRVKMLYQHKVDVPIGRWTEFRSDEKGLFVYGEISLNIPLGRDIYHLVMDGVLDGLSIGFKTVRSEKIKSNGKRKIFEAQLWEISIVTFPMATGARITSITKNSERNNDIPMRAGLSTQPARRAPLSPSGARQFADALRGAADILSL